MAKLTKTALKGIVKECLVEILTEGLLGNHAMVENRARPQKKKAQSRGNKTNTRAATNTRFQKKLQETTSALTQDPVMAAIFEDTARTTLQEQIQNESTPMVPRHDLIESDTHSEDPVDQIFEGSSNWATLAFADKKNI